MTDEEIVKRARRLVERGPVQPGTDGHRIVDQDDAMEARYIVPALLEVIDRLLKTSGRELLAEVEAERDRLREALLDARARLAGWYESVQNALDGK